MRINYRLSFLDAAGNKIPGPAMQAPEDAVETAGIEVWTTPETDGPFYEAKNPPEAGDVRIVGNQVEAFDGTEWAEYRKETM
jgi:hypothetical protein